jgi:hypothetical protein
MKEIILSRKEIFDLVWSKPITSIIKEYSISSYELRKVCNRLSIPLPKAGYWEKVKFNKAVERAEFIEASDLEETIKLSLRELGENKYQKAISPIKLISTQIEKDKSISIIVPKKLKSKNILILEAKKSLEEHKKKYSHHNLFTTDLNQLNIKVGGELLNRSLCFMDTFIKITISRGHKIKIKNNLTYLTIKEEEIEIYIREKLKRLSSEKNNSWPKYDFIPCGILVFCAKIYIHSFEWKDGIKTLETQLSEIIAKLEIKAEEARLSRIEMRKYWAEKEEIVRIENERLKLIKKEEENFNALLNDAKRWKEAILIREYISEIRKNFISPQFHNSEIEQWLLWARKKADLHDPLISFKVDFKNEN